MKCDLIGEILQKLFSLTGPQLEEGLRFQEEKGGKIGEVLTRLKYVQKDNISISFITF